MRTYRPGFVADETLRRELNSLVQAANRADSFVQMTVITDASKLPTRFDSSIATYVTVDSTVGATPAFGSGAGLYRNIGSGWTFIG